MSENVILLDADLRGAVLRGAMFAGAVLRDANLQGANLEGTDLRGAAGVSAQQICSARWAGALLDADLNAQVQLQCGSNRSATAQ